MDSRNYRDGRKRIIEEILSDSSISEKGCKLDKVAYIRFASVYKQFDSVEQFTEELSELKD